MRYRYYLLIVIIYEIYYFLFKKYDGDKFYLSASKPSTPPIPTPYFFLTKIYFFLKKKNFYSFCDLGCGYGRVCFFFKKKFKNKKIIGYENNTDVYKEAKKRIKVLNEDILNIKLNYDVIFFCHPFKNKKLNDYLLLKCIKSRKLKYLIIVNYLKPKKYIKNMRIATQFKINNTTGFVIYKR